LNRYLPRVLNQKLSATSFFFFLFFVWTARLAFEARRCCVAHPQNLQHPSNLSIALPGRTKPVKWKKKDELAAAAAAAAAASSIGPFGALPGLTNRKSFNRNGYMYLTIEVGRGFDRRRRKLAPLMLPWPESSYSRRIDVSADY
jgi:hypothetical protein